MSIKVTKKRILSSVTILAMVLGGVSACFRGDDSSDTDSISNRSQFRDMIVIIKLEAPALLTTASRVDGTVTIDTELRDRIIAEQKSFIKTMKNLDSSIKVLHQYKMVLNAVALIADRKHRDLFVGMNGTSNITSDEYFAPMTTEDQINGGIDGDISRDNSASFIGALKVAEELGIDGEGIKVGVIDTGIDYTHAMFGGEGTVEAYKANDPTKIEAGSFPTTKVAGGIDLVGMALLPKRPYMPSKFLVPDLLQIQQ
jgi:minor extracellular serine protease Vpr